MRMDGGMGIEVDLKVEVDLTMAFIRFVEAQANQDPCKLLTNITVS